MKNLSKAVNRKLLLFVSLLTVLTPNFVFAVAKATAAKGDFETIVNKLFTWTIGIAASLFILMFLYGGISYITSAGEEKKTESAKKTLVNAVIGLLVIAICYSIGVWLMKSFGITGSGIITNN